MVFRAEYGERYHELVSCGAYHPYRRHGDKNPNFDAYSGTLLDLKESQANAIELFRKFLETIIAPDVPIAIVPSHDPAKRMSGLRLLAQQVASSDRIDATGCLLRTAKIEKLATGGARSLSIHLDSIEVREVELIQGRDVLLLDDISTSGNSLEACSQLLLEAGASRVQKLALAKTA